MKTTKESRNTLLFMVLGDGWIGRYLYILHSTKQLDYLEWKKKILSDHGIKTNTIRFKNNNGYPACSFTTKSYKFISLYRKVLYTPSKNIANRKLLNKLNPLGLAIWYMDDGGLSQKKRNGKVHANELILNTHLSKEDNQIIIDYFLETWNIKFSQVKNKGKYRLRCGTKQARKFIAIVEPYVKQVPSMQHKINIIKKGFFDVEI
ncbi:hypothetical protein [Priestia megaterium]|uniref:hypothetical protein n=1 Tax=Priestia megaterium TaxID=1404 RepID=UPI00244C3B8B|nr:hypothetical protein [Priestia megaterium]MDH2363784.1 hypothetical protein [Priestia megaterium]